MKNKIIYTFTAERLIEFKDRNLGQIINSTTYLNNLDNKLDLKNDFNYYGNENPFCGKRSIKENRTYFSFTPKRIFVIQME